MVDFLGLTKYFRTMLDFKRPLDVRPDPVWTRTRSVTFCQVWQILWIKYYIRYYLKPRCMKQVLQYQYCHICSSFLPHTVLNVMIYRQLITLCHYFIALLIDSLWFYELLIYTWQIHHIYNHSSDIYVFNACSIICKKNKWCILVLSNNKTNLIYEERLFLFVFNMHRILEFRNNSWYIVPFLGKKVIDLYLIK